MWFHLGSSAGLLAGCCVDLPVHTHLTLTAELPGPALRSMTFSPTILAENRKLLSSPPTE